MKYTYTFENIADSSIDLEKAMKDNVSMDIIADKRKALSAMVEKRNTELESSVWEKVTDIPSFFANLYYLKVTCTVSKIDGTVKRNCTQKLNRFSLVHYVNARMNEAKQADFDCIAEQTLASMKKAGKLYMNGEATETSAIAKKALKEIATFIGLDKVDIRTSVARVAVAQFVQMTGVTANNIRALTVGQWVDVATRCIAVNTYMAGKFAIDADSEQVKKIADSLGLVIKK